jgi:hypothetical protein
MLEANMRSLIVGILFLVIFKSCGPETIDPFSTEGKLVTRINTTCSDSNSCTIRLKDVTDFDWDRVYVFKYTARKSEIEKVIGVPFPQYEEFKRSIIFVKGGKLVHGEANPTDVEGLINNEVVFDIADGETYKSYSSESQFEVRRKNFQGGVYYELRLIQSPQMN